MCGVSGEMHDKLKEIDIIIPIYNAYEDLVKCISSIWRHTNLLKNRLILVNDRSTDPRIEPYLASIGGGNVIVHNSVQNGGFSASVNIGMHYSESNDVILLNSDTIVTSSWVEKIAECAHSDDSIATVTPLSNSATLASIPVFGQDNPVPENVTIEEFAEIVERCSFRAYPQITVAVGFCMYIKRKVIEEIGFFDAETFGKGYGEENDFCCRAEIMGYKHVLCDDTFIYHKGTGSFLSEQKKALAEEHVKILEERYPKAMRNNHLFCMSRPYQYIRDNIIMYLKLYNRKKNILYVLHSDFRDDMVTGAGGTQLHVRDLTYGLKENCNVFVLAKEPKRFCLSCYTADEVYTFEFDDDNVSSYPLFRSKSQKKMLENILSAFRIDLVHVHHISAMSLEIYYVAEQMRVPVVTSIHDFYMLCPTYFLYNTNGKFCGGYYGETCGECLCVRSGIYGGNNYIKKWREQMCSALELNSMIVFPSDSARQVFCNVYSSDVPTRIIEHGATGKEAVPENIVEAADVNGMQCNVENIDFVSSNIIEGWAFWPDRDNKKIGIIVQVIQKGKVIQEVKAKKQYRMDVDEVFQGEGKYQLSGFQAHIDKTVVSAKEKLSVKILFTQGDEAYPVKQIKNVVFQPDVISNGIRVAFIGGVSDIKGSSVIYEMVKEGDDIEWFIFGDIAPNEKLAGYTAHNWHRFGTYNRQDLNVLLRHYEIDIVCIMSQCSETFCYTLSEAWEAKLPVIGFDIGAVGERIKRTGAGITVPVSAGAKEIVDKIRGLHTDIAWDNIRKNVETNENKTIEHMVKEYEELYKELYGDTKYGKIKNPEMIWKAYEK